MNPIQKIPQNTNGRDFVIGDLHGSLPSLEELMAEVKFNSSRDRILCVGDLTDRGPDSAGCLKLLQEPWFHCVLGNHDENTIAVLENHLSQKTLDAQDPEPWYFLARNGGQWLCQMAAERKNESLLRNSLELLKFLPHILVVGEGAKRFHLVHGSAVKMTEKHGIKPLTDERIDQALSGEKPLKNLSVLNTDRSLARHAWDTQSENPQFLDALRVREGLSPTYCGHTSIPEVTTMLSHVHIDTGAGKPDRPEKIRYLTAIEPATGQIFQSRAGNPRIKIKNKHVVKTAIKTACSPERDL